MKYSGCAFVALTTCLLAFSVSAQPPTEPFSLSYKGLIEDGPLAGYEFHGTCGYDANGDPLVQTGNCQLTARGPNEERLDLMDRRAHLAVTGDGLLLQISLGLATRTASPKGNPKIAAFTSTTVFKEPVTLLKRFPSFVAASFSVLGTTASTSDCLIYDFAGPNVHDASR